MCRMHAVDNKSMTLYWFVLVLLVAISSAAMALVAHVAVIA